MLSMIQKLYQLNKPNKAFQIFKKKPDNLQLNRTWYSEKYQQKQEKMC